MQYVHFEVATLAMMNTSQICSRYGHLRACSLTMFPCGNLSEPTCNQQQNLHHFISTRSHIKGGNTEICIFMVVMLLTYHIFIMCLHAGMTALQLQILGVGELLSGTRGHVVPVGVSMVLPPRVLNLPHISGTLGTCDTPPMYLHILTANHTVLNPHGLSEMCAHVRHCQQSGNHLIRVYMRLFPVLMLKKWSVLCRSHGPRARGGSSYGAHIAGSPDCCP